MTIADDLRERLEKIEAERGNPYMRLRCDEVRTLLDDLDVLDDQVTALMIEVNVLRRANDKPLKK